jgi:endo-1,4-beta-xylanase
MAGSSGGAGDSLKGAARKAGLEFGASASREIFDDPDYAALYRREAALITTDIAFKFDHLRWREKEWDFAEADRLLLFARNNDMALRGHCLFWNENAPSWLRRRPARELRRIMDEHIDKVVGRYVGMLHSLDVINEPFWPGHGVKGGWRNGPWLEAMGADYISRALKRVAAIDPELPLVINEAHCERDDEVGRAIRKNLLELIDRLQDEGAPLDAIGLQGHILPGKPWSREAYAEFIGHIEERGLNIYISELDIDYASLGGASQMERDALAARRYGELLDIALSSQAAQAVICWQLADKYSWYAHEARKKGEMEPRPLPFDNELRPKPIRDAMIKSFRRRKIRR